jgi:hypothetical protein
MMSHLKTLILGTAMIAALAAHARAEAQKLRVPVDESTILNLPTTPGAIVIGNPSIADVSIQGQKLFVHGRTFGQTNLTILDLEGNQVASFDLLGVRRPDDTVAVFKEPLENNLKGLWRYTYSCVDGCESILTVGDEPKFFGISKDQTKDKNELATGSTTAEAKAPEAPQ